MLMHPDLDSRISLDRTGEPQKFAHGDFISTLSHKAGSSSLAVSSAVRRSSPAPNCADEGNRFASSPQAQTIIADLDSFFQRRT
jgi:hypothetical protein